LDNTVIFDENNRDFASRLARLEESTSSLNNRMTKIVSVYADIKPNPSKE
jgi:hypothetical protein